MAAALNEGRPPLPAVLGVVEGLDADGQPRWTQPVHAWPLTIGRALDNDLVLGDPHVAAHHAAVVDVGDGLDLVAGQTTNGLQCDATTLTAGQRLALSATGEAPLLRLGRTRLRLRLPGHALAPELPLPAEAPPPRRHAPWPTLTAGAVLLAGLLTTTWLEADPDNSARALAGILTSALVGVAIWCGAWALLTRTFTGRSRFGWHLRVLLTAAAAWGVVDTASELVAFALSWPWVSDFAFVAGYAIAAAAMYAHLLAFEPHRRTLLRGVAVAAFVGGTALSLWLQQQRQERLGAELYMSHLFPPALRLARPVGVERFVDGLAGLQPVLDRRAKEPPHGGGGSDGETIDGGS